MDEDLKIAWLDVLLDGVYAVFFTIAIAIGICSMFNYMSNDMKPALREYNKNATETVEEIREVIYK